MHTLLDVRSRTERLAYWIWVHRGQPDGSANDDWFLAEALLERQLSPRPGASRDASIFAFGIERQTR
jgi:hypothetical protein